MTKVSILLVGKGPPDSGGISSMLNTLQRELMPRYEVQLLNLTRQTEYRAGVFSSTNVSRTLSDIWSVFRTAGSFDVVHLHSSFVPAVTLVRAALLLLAARLRGAATILHVHGGSLPEWADSRWKRWLIRTALMTATEVVSVSDGITRAIGADRTRTIYNGVDTNTFAPDPSRQAAVPVIVFAGILTHRKGVVDLIEASHALITRGVKHRLVIVGGRPDEGAEEEASVRSAATGGEELVGSLPHDRMADYFRDADIFCLPSWFEAMPLSILEALASGLPVVATRVGQIPLIIDDSVGRLVEPKDPEALAATLEELLSDHQLRGQLAKNARAAALTHYSLTHTMSEIVDVIDRAAGQPRTAL
ncbi:MAG: glycosyltransferase family 4 protein [Acidimicrobiia bacterium]|nr:glycosyltransferase family 4 protein [Acidimicrobiia bacterium]